MRMVLNSSSHFAVAHDDSRLPERSTGLLHKVSTALHRLLPVSPSPHTAADLAGTVATGENSSEAYGGLMAALKSVARKQHWSPLMDAVFRHADIAEVQLAPTSAEIKADIDAILESFSLQRIRRFYGQVHWSDETTAAEFSDRVEPGLKLENVAAHSWHVADAAHLLVGHFPKLDPHKVVTLALLHDKLEMYTGDYDPVGLDGQGTNTHAFSVAARNSKQVSERRAAERYVRRLRAGVRQWQQSLFDEVIEGTSDEARFVKSIDKLQALAFVIEKKSGNISDEHLLFTLRYSRKALSEFPRIRFHYAEILNRFLDGIAKRRGISRMELDKRVFGQLELPL